MSEHDGNTTSTTPKRAPSPRDVLLYWEYTDQGPTPFPAITIRSLRPDDAASPVDAMVFHNFKPQMELIRNVEPIAGPGGWGGWSWRPDTRPDHAHHDPLRGE
jgi:hypothetical protein